MNRSLPLAVLSRSRSLVICSALWSALSGCSGADSTNNPAAAGASGSGGTGNAGGVAGSSGSSGSAGTAAANGSSGSAGSAASGGSGGVGGASGATGDDLVLISPSLFNTVLGRPTDSSVAISVLPRFSGDSMFIEYGTQLSADHLTLLGSSTSSPVSSSSGEPVVIDLVGLEKNTKYYYRVHAQAQGQAEAVDNIHSFHTQRAVGAAFHFGVQGDTHPERFNNKMFHKDLFTLTMEQVRNRQPDLYFTLGDDFSIEKIIQNFKDVNYGAGYAFHRGVEGVESFDQYSMLAHPFSESMIVDGVSAPQSNAAYLEMREKYFGMMANATSLLLTNGNHEQAHLANLGGIFNNASIWAADARLKYYPLPAPGSFYSGDEHALIAQNGYPTISASDGLLRDYYAFTWGDALFGTLDPYWHSSEVSPDSTLFADPEPPWGATLGDDQYNWLKQTLENSPAKWKFVFAHHINGNNRGGAAVVGTQEWGGEPGFSENRPTWSKPVHQLLADNHVTIFFQGHDHMFAREKVDGVVYQEVPNPADNSYFAYNCDAYAPASISWSGPSGYGNYDPSYNVRLPNTGFLDVAVSADHVTVSYIRTYREIDLSNNPNGAFSGAETNGETAFSYSIPPRPEDTSPSAISFTCLGAAPPNGWVYNP